VLLQGLVAGGSQSVAAYLGAPGTPFSLGSVAETMRMARALLQGARTSGGPPAVDMAARATWADSTGFDPAAAPVTQPGDLTGPEQAGDVGTAPPVTVQMLDGMQVWIGLEPLADVPRGKARALLKLLVLRRHRPLSRTRLCTLLWPDAEPDHARNNLNVTLHRLRRALGEAIRIRHGESGYQLDTRGPVWIDTEHFLQRADLGVVEEAHGRTQRAIGQYEGAASIYRCGLLDDDEGTEPALAADALLLRDRLNQVLDRLAALREETGSLHSCVQATQRHLGLDECNEQAHRRLMRCYARLGQPLLAEQQYRRCVDAMKTLLGIGPSGETTELMRRIGRGQTV
jgi:DNA-binding SARP family transcriptional activator